MQSLIYFILNPNLYHYFPIDMRKFMPCILETNISIPIKDHTIPIKGDSSDMLKIWSMSRRL